MAAVHTQFMQQFSLSDSEGWLLDRQQHTSIQTDRQETGCEQSTRDKPDRPVGVQELNYNRGFSASIQLPSFVAHLLH